MNVERQVAPSRAGDRLGGRWRAAVTTGWLVLVMGGVAGAAETGEATKVEPWAEQSLTVRRGLMLWLDAGRQPAAWEANGRPALASGDEVDVWYDGSGRGGHVAQGVKGSRPRYVAGEHAAAVRFDGENDYLHRGTGKTEVGAFTAVLAVAPRSNVGGFRAFVSASELGKNDFVTGLNVDLGPFGSGALDVLNVEGRGFRGFRNLVKGAAPFRQLQVITLAGDSAEIRAYMDGKVAGRRERAAGAIRADQLYVGSRYYSNTGEPPFVSGFLDGDVAEVLFYDRVLSPEEVAAVSAYVSGKQSKYAEEVGRAGGDGEVLRPVENPPDVQVFVPGFGVRRIPVDLTNVNNVRYREDGRLVALAYDGNVYVLSDTDGDGLEDKADLFWDNRGRVVSPIGMALTPPGYPAGRGLFVASKGKVSLILDADGDGRAEKEVIVADGWTALPHQVDALGVALGADGSVYFGLGTTNFTNAYLTDASGKAQYDLRSERGTIMKVSPDFSKREIVCTGIRFPVGLAFNGVGDLFATDQEGATWLPNGNPFDELLHIQPGRHYGFPPRHPTHLPGVVDEPSVFDYAPQHQSTCGLFFNEPVNGGPVFGPASWRGDVLVCGESRGKLYRTRLVKTGAGYVAKNDLLASLTMLTIDACVSPQGDLVVATHSGNPDWGSGPKGKGRLYKIRHTDKEVPQPVASWASGPYEVRIAFDRPLDPSILRDVAKGVSVDYGAYVGAGDRFEKIRPGYEVVRRQANQRRQKLAVTGVQVTADRRTLVIGTARQSHAVSYAVTLPGLGGAEAAGGGGVEQVDAVDLAYDLGGVEAEWQPSDAGAGEWAGWLPHPDPAVSRAFTVGSAGHDALWQVIGRPGRMSLRTSLDLWNMSRPAVQPGSQVDYTLPAEEVTIVVGSNVPVEVRCAAAETKVLADADGMRRVSVTVTPAEGAPLPLEIIAPTGSEGMAITVTFSTREDPRPRAMPLRRFLLPWASPKPEDAAATEVAKAEMPQLKGGSWTRGREVFFGEQAGCAKCHRVGGRGSDLGPDLSNLVHRDYDSVLRDIREPSGALNPDYIASAVRLKDGSVFHGILRGAGKDEFIVRGDVNGEKTPFHRDRIEKVTASAVSVMPAGIEKALTPEQLRDLMTYLLTQPLEPAPLERTGAPPARTRAELDAVLGAASDSERAADAAPLRVLLSAGPKDHGPGEHDYPRWQERWAKLLAMSDGVRVATCQGFPSVEQFAAADVVVFYSNNPGWSKEKAANLDAFLGRGGGVVYVHYAVDGHKAPAELAERIGLAWGAGSKFRHGALDLTFTKEPHPITAGFSSLGLVDESYWNLGGDPTRIRTLAAGAEEGKDQPLLWVREQGKGRVFVSIPGHYAWTFDDPLFRVLLLRGIAWTGGRPAERLTHLATIGARVQN
jgi:putative heme-binding domain-containing protein